MSRSRFPGVCFVVTARVKDPAAADMDALGAHVAAEMIPHAEAEEGTLAYQYGAGRDSVSFIEWYRDSDALVKHLAALGPRQLGPLGKVTEAKRADVYGNVSDELRRVILGLRIPETNFYAVPCGFGGPSARL